MDRGAWRAITWRAMDHKESDVTEQLSTPHTFSVSAWFCLTLCCHRLRGGQLLKRFTKYNKMASAETDVWILAWPTAGLTGPLFQRNQLKHLQ